MFKSIPKDKLSESPCQDYMNKILITSSSFAQSPKEIQMSLATSREDVIHFDRVDEYNILKSPSLKQLPILSFSSQSIDYDIQNNTSCSMPNYTTTSIYSEQNKKKNIEIPERDHTSSPITTRLDNHGPHHTRNSKNLNSLLMSSEFKLLKLSINQLSQDEYVHLHPKTSEFGIPVNNRKNSSLGTMENITIENENSPGIPWNNSIYNIKLKSHLDYNIFSENDLSSTFQSKYKEYLTPQKANDQSLAPKNYKKSLNDDDNDGQDKNLEIQNFLLKSINKCRQISSRELIPQQVVSRPRKLQFSSFAMLDDKMKAIKENNKLEKEVLKSQILGQINIKRFVKPQYQDIFI